MEKKLAWVVDPQNDNVATVLADEVKEDNVLSVDLGGKTVEVKMINDIPYGHKFALKPIQKGEQIIKYGTSIGRSIKEIQPGEHVHLHNIEPLRGRGDLAQK